MSDYDLKELLEIIGEEAVEESTASVVYDNDVDSFIIEKNITAGLDRIPNRVVYYTYSKVHGGELSKIEFFRQFKKRDFRQYRTKRGRGYELEGSSFDLTREGIVKASYYEEEVKQKRKDKVPKSRSSVQPKKKKRLP